MKPVSIEFISEDACVHGRFYAVVPAVRSDKPVTLLLVPGWPANAEDFLGLGSLLSQQGVNVMEFYPRGLHTSEGIYTHSGALQDIGSAIRWLRQPDVQKQLKVDPDRFVLAGYSNGGGLAMVYATRDPSIQRVISIAGNDFGEFVRQVQHDAVFATGMRAWLFSTRAPEGPAHFDPEAGLQELIGHPDIFGLRENAGKLADRSILMFGGWEDEGPTIENYQLPFYRALKAAGAEKVTFIVYHTDHSFSNVYERLATDITEWIHRQVFN
jgi:dipeptidyl aminopeptidase/acylaminoacyl peptidase